MTPTAIIQNNLAVAHLRANKIKSARSLSASALLEHRQMVNSADCVQSRPRSSGTATESRIDQCMFLLNPCDHTAHTEEVNAFIYKTGIEIPTVETNPDIIAAILIFNTALAHHLLAARNANDSIEYLQKAKSMYELAYRTHGASCNTLFQFAILNNVAMIYRELGVEPTATQIFDSLLSVWMVLVDRGCELEMRHVQGFLKNLATADKEVAAAA